MTDVLKFYEDTNFKYFIDPNSTNTAEQGRLGLKANQYKDEIKILEDGK